MGCLFKKDGLKSEKMGELTSVGCRIYKKNVTQKYASIVYSKHGYSLGKILWKNE